MVHDVMPRLPPGSWWWQGTPCPFPNCSLAVGGVDCREVMGGGEFWGTVQNFLHTNNASTVM